MPVLVKVGATNPEIDFGIRFLIGLPSGERGKKGCGKGFPFLNALSKKEERWHYDRLSGKKTGVKMLSQKFCYI